MKKFSKCIALVLVGLGVLGTTESLAQRKMKPNLSRKGKINLAPVIAAPADQVAEGDRLFKSHERWMASTHHRTGEKALLSCCILHPARQPTR